MNKGRIISLFVTFAIISFFLFKIRNEAQSSSFSIQEPFYFLLVLGAGLMAFLMYTASWYFLLVDLEVPFRKLLLLNLLGSYLSISINSALGMLVKCKYLGVGWARSLGAYAMVVVFELLPGLLVLSLGGSIYAIVVMLLFIWAVLHEDSLYPIISVPFKLLRMGEFIRDFYLGWKLAKKGNLPAAFLSSLLQVFFLAVSLVSAGKAFGFEFSLGRATVAVLYSTVLGTIGTPGGIGGNELGVVLALGMRGSLVAVAFTYKLLTQYIYIVPGAVAFYRYLSSWKGLSG